MNTKVICTFNNPEIFEKVVKNNKNLKNCEVIEYDNTNENIAITKRYNDFIEKYISSKDYPNEDFWCFFIHQDFGITENIENITEKLNHNYIYGAIGAKILRGLFFGKKSEDRFGFKTRFKLILGEILQGENDFNLKPYGHKLLFQRAVNSIDCCCIIIHSSLIKKYDLHFDENLSFHMYAEELCYRTKKDYKIKTKVVQMKCYHLGKGILNEEFKKSVKYLEEKFKVKKIPSTCYT